MAVLQGALMVLLIFVNFQVKKCAFLSSDSIGLTITGKEVFLNDETYILSSLWHGNGEKRAFYVRLSRRSLLTLLILMCGDIESCPGPQAMDARCVPELNTLLDQSGMKIFHQNVRGLFSNKPYLTELFQNFKGIDILTLSETHITEEDPESLFEIPGYTFVSNYRKTGKGGGVAAYISNNTVWERRQDLENEVIESIWIEITLKHAKNILIGIFYRPPDSSKYLHRDFNNTFNEVLSSVSSEPNESIVLGDFNVNYLVPGDNPEFKAILNLYGFKQMIKKPTRISGSTKTLIDIIATNNPISFKATDVIPLSIGDHDMIGCVRKINSTKFKPRTIICRDYKRYNQKAMNNELKLVDWSYVYNNSNVNSAWTYMKTIITGIYQKHAPVITKRVKGKPASWLTVELKQLMNERDSLLRKYRRTTSDEDFQAYKLKRNKVNTSLRQAKSSYNKNLLEENSKTPETFWKIIKSIYPAKSTNKNMNLSFEIDGEMSTDASKISNAFSLYFNNIVATLKQKAFPLRNLVWRNPKSIGKKTENVFKFRNVSISGVERQLRSLKSTKSTGCDNLPPGLLKDSATTIAPPLTHIINLSMQSGLFPSEWKSAKIIPVHKSGLRSSFDNYRPISVLPAISKVMEKIIHRQVMNFLNENKLLSQNQFGFRSQMSTELAAVKFIDEIRMSVDKANLVGAVFIDLTKAFDTISHSKLLGKLPQYGISGAELDWFGDYLFKRATFVSYNNHTSQECHLRSGVPQGSILGPLLFLISFNDITDVIEQSRIVKYADDVVLYVADKNMESIKSKLTKDLVNIADWLDENDLIINLKEGKTEALLFGTAKRICKSNVSLSIPYGNTVINLTEKYKYLGVEVDSTLNLNTHFDACYKRASTRLRLLSKIRDCLNVDSARTIYQSMITPLLTYCGILNLNLTSTQLHKLTSFRERATKVIFKDFRPDSELPSIMDLRKKRACEIVRRTLDGNIPEALMDHFVIKDHGRETRNRGYLINLPTIKLEYARRGFYFMGAKLYNELPLNIRTATSSEGFDKLLKLHFS